MDIYSLVAANLHTEPRQASMNARAEDRYYASQITLPHLAPRLLGSIAMMAGVILILGMSLI